MVDVDKALRMAVDTGKVKFGTRDAAKSAMSGKTKMIVLSSNCPADTKADIENYSELSGLPVLSYNGTGYELGEVCGKPFVISAMAIDDPGNSRILDAVKEKK